MISKLIKLPIFKRLIPSLSIRILKLLRKNRGYFKVNDIKMFLDFLDPIDRKIILNQEFENSEINFLIKQIKENNINYFLDVGANCGYYSILISKKISKIKIFAFEPNKEAYIKFQKTLKKNPNIAKKINLKKFGLSNKSKKLKMQSMVKYGYSQTGGTSVIKDIKYKNFNTFFANFQIGDEFIKLKNQTIAIKIDVEGHEINVLDGLKNILQRNKIILQIEIYEKNFKIVNDLILSFGYRLIFKVKERSNYFYINIK